MSIRSFGDLNPVRSFVQPNSQAQPDKVFYSDYFITISSNVSVKNRNGPEILRIHHALLEVLNCTTRGFNLQHIFKKVNEGGKWTDEPIDPNDFLEAPKQEITRETGVKGSRGNRAHLHVLMSTKHYHRMQIDRKTFIKIAQDCVKQNNAVPGAFQLKKIYINIKWVPSRQGYLDYMGKQSHENDINALADLPVKSFDYWENYDPEDNPEGNYPE